MIQLPTIQAEALKNVFEEQFDEEEVYFEYVEIDEVFNVLIGGEIDPHFYDMLELSVPFDDFNSAFAVMIHEYLEILETESVELEFYELAHNCKNFKEKIDNLIKKYE